MSGEDPIGEHVKGPDISYIDEKRLTAWVSRFVDKLKKRYHVCTTECPGVAENKITVGTPHSTKALYRHHRQDLQTQLNLRTVHGRFSNSDLTKGVKDLLKKEYFTKLVVEHYHQKTLHSCFPRDVS